MDLRRIILARYALILAFVLVFSFMIAGRIVFIQVTTSEKWDNKLETLENKTEVIFGDRGNICSTNGRVMATSIPFYEIRFDLAAPGVSEVFDAEIGALAVELSKMFTDRSEWQFKNQLKKAYQKKERYHLVHPRKVNYDELKRIEKFPIFKRGAYRGGFIAEQEYIRFTPHGNLAYRTIGMMNKGAYGGMLGSIGISGIEGQFEGYLRGEEGLAVRQNLSGRWVNISMVEPENGNDVITTIDIYLQDVVESSLRKQLVKSDAEYGTAVLMEVKTGKVRAISNLTRHNGGYAETYNWAIGHQGSNEPGSTFKLISMMVALDEAKIDTSDVYDTEDGKWKIYDRTIYDSDYGYGEHGKKTVKEIFEVSSNVGVAKIIEEHYGDRPREFVDRLYNLGLNRPLGLGFRGEAEPWVKYPTDKNWWGTSLAYLAHGYEVNLSPLHVLAFYNAVANDGKMMKPMFIEEVRASGRTMKKFKPEVLRNSICSKETVGKLQSMLEGVVKNGTARKLQSNLYSFAGKTGTAKIMDTELGYVHRKYRASFVGYFPADNPKYSCIVVISEPKGSFYGGTVAGPVFREIADCVYTTDLSLDIAQHSEGDEMKELPEVMNGAVDKTLNVFRELGIQYSGNTEQADWVVVNETNENARLEPKKIDRNIMPDVTGMGAADAIYLIEKSGMKSKLKGVGKVQKQFPLPGVTCRDGQLVYLDLS
ncbi:MAG: penicillin-binding transpeptidase domain-containing protein [Prolixibacteraceae bacterium]|jgi:cell division protein FtsI (penicillin-binding protein 3)|nr:penicillin-binding transpeptidase domain-containing protein [Prolixibacteraceae bacterium]